MGGSVKKKRRASCEDCAMLCFRIVQTRCYRFFSVRDDFICFRMKFTNTFTMMFCFLFCLIPIGFILIYVSCSIWVFNIYIRCHFAILFHVYNLYSYYIIYTLLCKEKKRQQIQYLCGIP